jgi:hypothetical protein
VFSDLCRILGFTLPYDLDAPAFGAKLQLGFCISLDVSRELRPPEILAILRHRSALTALVLMPKTPMNEDGDFVFRENQIRRALQVAPMQPKAEAHCMRGCSYTFFGLGVFSPNTRHYSAALERTQFIQFQTFGILM